MKSHYVKLAPKLVIVQKWEKISWTSRSIPMSLHSGKKILKEKPKNQIQNLNQEPKNSRLNLGDVNEDNDSNELDKVHKHHKRMDQELNPAAIRVKRRSLPQHRKAPQYGLMARDFCLPPVPVKSSRNSSGTTSPTNSAYLPRVTSKYKHWDRKTFNDCGN